MINDHTTPAAMKMKGLCETVETAYAIETKASMPGMSTRVPNPANFIRSDLGSLLHCSSIWGSAPDNQMSIFSMHLSQSEF